MVLTHNIMAREVCDQVAKEPGINPDQIMVGGESAGSGLAAAVSMLFGKD